jgi:hypothetical protein
MVIAPKCSRDRAENQPPQTVLADIVRACPRARRAAAIAASSQSILHIPLSNLTMCLLYHARWAAPYICLHGTYALGAWVGASTIALDCDKNVAQPGVERGDRPENGTQTP